jgi:anti-anti-sigma factor
MNRPSPSESAVEGTLRVERVGEAVVLVLRGDHDARTVALLRERIHELVAGGWPLVVDVSETTFIDSLTLNEVAYADRLLQNAGRRLVLCFGERSPVRRAFALLGLDSYIPNADSRRAAAALAARPAGR